MNWYALHVRSCCERRVESRLDDAGLEHFSPFVAIQRKSKAKAHPFERTEKPLLPGYVFARFDFEDRSGDRLAVVRIPELVRILGFGEQAVPIPDTEVLSLRVLIESRVSVSSIPLVAEGDYVRVNDGPLAGAEGYVVYVRTGNREVPRITVNVNMLGRSVMAEVDGDWLEKSTTPAVPATRSNVIQMPSRSVVVPPVRRAA